MKRRMRTYVLSILTVLAICAAWGQPRCAGGTFYLARTGDDVAGDGSPERPWRSVRHAAGAVPDDGSTIVLGDGLYVGSQSIDRRFENILTIRAENPYRARLRSPDGSNRVLSIYRGRNVVIEGLEMFGSGSDRGDYLVHVSTPNTEGRGLVGPSCGSRPDRQDGTSYGGFLPEKS